MVSCDDIAAAANRVFPFRAGTTDGIVRIKPDRQFERLFEQGIRQVVGEFTRRGLPAPVFGIGDEMQAYEQETHGYLDRLIHRAGAKTYANGAGPFPADSEDWRADAIRLTDIIMAGFVLTPYHGRTQQGFPESVPIARHQGKRLMTHNFEQLHQPVQAGWQFVMGWLFASLGEGCEGQFVHSYHYAVDDPYGQLDGRYPERSVVFPPIPERDLPGRPTINYEAMREGIDDTRCLSTLKRVIATARRQKLDAEADAAERMMRSLNGSFDFSTTRAGRSLKRFFACS